MYVYSVARTFRKKFQSAARNSDIRLSSAGYEHIPVDFHVPILDIDSLTSLSLNRVLTNVVIQGTFEMGRRDYARIFSQLNASLYGAPTNLNHRTSPNSIRFFLLVVDPESWGYSRLQVDGGNSTFVPLPDTPPNHAPPFKLHLVGHGYMVIPPEFENIVILHNGLDYPEFYTLMSEMDVCLPAFARDSDTNYVSQASSTVVMCLENNVRASIWIDFSRFFLSTGT